MLTAIWTCKEKRKSTKTLHSTHFQAWEVPFAFFSQGVEVRNLDLCSLNLLRFTYSLQPQAWEKLELSLKIWTSPNCHGSPGFKCSFQRRASLCIWQEILICHFSSPFCHDHWVLIASVIEIRHCISHWTLISFLRNTTKLDLFPKGPQSNKRSQKTWACSQATGSHAIAWDVSIIGRFIPRPLWNSTFSPTRHLPGIQDNIFGT